MNDNQNMADQSVGSSAEQSVSVNAMSSSKIEHEKTNNKVTAKNDNNNNNSNNEEGPKNITRCLVHCRLRPKNKTDTKDGGTQIITVKNNQIIVKDEAHYDYDMAFDDKSTQEDLFKAVAVPCINHAFQGFCSALMCYGQTGTGKSFTMCNTTQGHEGIIPRAAKLIFEKVNSDPTRHYQIMGQFVQIYRDNLSDLMKGDGKDRVEIHFDDDDGVELTGCSSHELHNEQEFMHFYHAGNERRVVTATAMNPESSRGHTALVIRISSERTDDPAAGKMKGKITFIDLAGYERFSKTGIDYDNPIMRDEAKCINASLLALGHVVSALSASTRHIPWRNSKLTRILQDSIGGRSRTSIILTIGPSSNHFHETTNTLQFGLRAMDVKVSAKQSVSVDYQKLAHKLQSLLNEKDAKINLLEIEIASREASLHEVNERYEQSRAILRERYERESAQQKATGASEQQVQKLREVYEAELENLREQQNEEVEYQAEAHSKEIIKLIREQERQEAKRRAEMKLAQERIIEEFQNKLENAREGKNDDLVNALQQLAQKDSILASRANDTARLHEHIEVLTEQIKELGGIPVKETIFPETFVDVGQVEEIQKQLEAEVERQRSKGTELRAQLDEVSLICSQRVDEIHKLQDENTHLRDILIKNGVKVDETDELTAFLREKRAMMVDITEMETLRVTMQADIDELTSHNKELQKEVERLKEELQQNPIPLTARIRCSARHLLPKFPQPLTSRGMGGARQFFLQSDEAKLSSLPPQPDTTQKNIKQLSDQLAFSMKEKKALQERIQELENTLKTHGAETPQPYIPPIQLKIPEVTSSSSTPALEEISPGNADIDLLLKVKEEEIDSFMETIERQEYLLTNARSNDEFNQQVIAELHRQLSEAQLTPPEHNTAPPPVESIAIDEYMDLLRTIRDGERKIALQLIEHNSDNDDPAEIEKILEEKDKELQLKDEVIIEKTSKAQYVAKICIRLKGQMERLGIIPCCELPDSYRELVEREEGELEDQIEFQKEMEYRLKLEEEEKQRALKLLQSMSEEREREASVFRKQQEHYKEVEEDAIRAKLTLAQLTHEKSQKEVCLEKALRDITRRFMDTQVELENLKEENKRLRRGWMGRLDRLFH